MEKAIIIVAILLIAIILLQSGKAESSAQLAGGQQDLLKDRKERGSEKVITYLTAILSLVFFVLIIIANR